MARNVRKRRRQSKICTAVILFTLILLALVVYVKSKDLSEKRTDLKVQAAELENQISDAQEKYTELEKQEEYMQTKKYVEDVARNRLGLVYPDEIVIRPEN